MESTVLGEAARALTSQDGREGLKFSFEEQETDDVFQSKSHKNVTGERGRHVLPTPP